MTENKNVFGILGHPLGHTLSPQIHTRLFEISGEQAEYKILDTPPEKLTDSFEYFKSLTGFNITIPYKIDIIKMCDTLDDTAKRYNSVNCIANVNGVSTGYNTDCTGFTKAVGAMGMTLTNKVLLLGCGGVGSNCCEALARGGIGHFVILDKDIIAPSNINRQAIAFHSTIGKRKVDVMEAMIHDINPAATVIKRTEYILSENTDDFFYSVLEQAGGKIDYVVDAIDTISAKLTVAKYAQDHDIRLVSSMGGGNKLHPECLRFADIFDTVRDPMSRIMRKECKKRGIKSLHVLFSCEESVKTQRRDPSNIHERTELGTASFMPPIMGQMIAGEVIRKISGRGTERVRADGQRLD